ncbi:MAG: AAA family ATPase, partial [Chitinophagaceae bacterium]|nr:AAA family ATPase [Chitinophagaceae bacterium]
MIRRKLQDDIVRLLKQFPAVSILGPRQVGKTTLAKQIAPAGKKQLLYLDMEKPADRNRLKDAHTYLNSYKASCIIIDEA